MFKRFPENHDKLRKKNVLWYLREKSLNKINFRYFIVAQN